MEPGLKTRIAKTPRATDEAITKNNKYKSIFGNVDLLGLVGWSLSNC